MFSFTSAAAGWQFFVFSDACDGNVEIRNVTADTSEHCSLLKTVRKEFCRKDVGM
jgi:hypothetical protein